MRAFSHLCIPLALLVLSPSSRGGDKDSAENARGRLEAAKKMYEGTLKRWKEVGGQVKTPVHYDPEFFYRWSVRWLDAESELGEKKEDRSRAAEEHLSRMKEVEKSVADLVKLGILPLYETAAAEFYRLEAEKWLGERKAK
jgi:hypothetical protein